MITLPYQRHAFNQEDALARPFLWLDLTGPGGSVRTQGIIDSGADFSCLPYGYAELLGYGAADLAPFQGSQVQGEMTFYRANVTTRALLPGDTADRAFDLAPNFVKNAEMILWGRLDFFRAWGIAFDERGQRFTLVRAN
jgi:hypothetical protein